MTTSGYIGVLLLALAGGALGAGLNACGRAESEEPLQIDSNTNWLRRCESDDQCGGALRCYCGQCSQPCSESDECGLLAGAECSPSRGAVCGGEPSQTEAPGGLCVLGCETDAQCGLDFSCAAGQCVPRPCERSRQTFDDLLSAVAADLALLEPENARFARYLSTANHPDQLTCGAALTAERQGASKLLNSLSMVATVTAPVEIDGQQTLYRIDLRDYAWDRAVNVSGVSYPDVWEALIANDRFAVPWLGEQADAAAGSSGTVIPLMFVNSFTATATRPEMYYAIVGMPETSSELFESLSAIETASPDVLAGMAGSSAGAADLVASYWALSSRTGYLWQIADTGLPRGELFVDPLRPPTGDRQLIFSLPNGLPAFAIMNGAGARSESSETFLDTEENDFRARAPRSFLRQHYPRPDLHDEVRTYVLAAPEAFEPSTEAEILRLYPGNPALQALLEDQYQTLTRRALELARVDASLPEPINLTLSAFDGDVGLAEVAGELLVSEEDLLDNLALLAPELAVLDGGRIDRDDFARVFPQALCTLASINENVPDPSYCGEP